MMGVIRKIVLLWLLLPGLQVQAQTGQKPFIKLVQPLRETNLVRNAKQFIAGSTCKNCSLTINGSPVKVYATGGFAYEIDLVAGANEFNLVARSGNTSASRKLSFRYSLPGPPDTVKTLSIASIETFPEGNLLVQPGEKIGFKVKAQPGAKLMVNGNTPLYEMPADPVPGIYQGEYTVQATDSFAATKIPVTITDTSGSTVMRRAESRVTLMTSVLPDMLVTKGKLAHLLYGLGEDRLGGAKIGYLDSLIPLRILGKVNNLYKVQLSKYRSAYIADDVVDFLPKGSFEPRSLTGNWRIFGDSLYDYVTVALFTRLPYQSFQQVNPSKIIVDIFGATNNTNWITQLENTKEIENVYYEQLEDEVLRVTIDLKHQQHWGHQIYYNGNRLTIKVRRQPENLELRNLRIAIDAGHGGGNTGAGGPTGSIEKELALDVSLKLRKALQYQGAQVIMTRNMEKFVDNKDRILLYRDSMPDLLISIHLNSSGDPVNVGGTSTYYKHIGFRNLGLDIYKRMLELGLKEYGNTGGFNFMLNSPIEYPNALVEMLFISNPEEEMMILDEGFQQKIADKIVLGIKDFLEGCKSGLIPKTQTRL